MADVMKRMSGMGMRERMREMQQLQKQGLFDPGGMLAKKKVGTGKRLTSEERNKLRKQREKEARKRTREQKKNRGR
jgi:signal recognition particle subunit SRP54